MHTQEILVTIISAGAWVCETPRHVIRIVGGFYAVTNQIAH